MGGGRACHRLCPRSARAARVLSHGCRGCRLPRQGHPCPTVTLRGRRLLWAGGGQLPRPPRGILRGPRGPREESGTRPVDSGLLPAQSGHHHWLLCRPCALAVALVTSSGLWADRGDGGGGSGRERRGQAASLARAPFRWSERRRSGGLSVVWAPAWATVTCYYAHGRPGPRQGVLLSLRCVEGESQARRGSGTCQRSPAGAPPDRECAGSLGARVSSGAEEQGAGVRSALPASAERNLRRFFLLRPPHETRCVQAQGGWVTLVSSPGVHTEEQPALSQDPRCWMGFLSVWCF